MVTFDFSSSNYVISVGDMDPKSQFPKVKTIEDIEDIFSNSLAPQTH